MGALDDMVAALQQQPSPVTSALAPVQDVPAAQRIYHRGDDPVADTNAALQGLHSQVHDTGSNMDWAMAIMGGPRLRAPLRYPVPTGEPMTQGIESAANNYIDKLRGNTNLTKLNWDQQRYLTNEGLTDSADTAANKTAIGPNILSRFISGIDPKDPEVLRDIRAKDLGYTMNTYHGKTGPEWDTTKIRADPYLYSTTDPRLASMYAHANPTPGKGPYSEQLEEYHNGGSQVMPLKVNPENYHLYEGAGKDWMHVNEEAIREARNNNASGVIIKNVRDEPQSGLSGYKEHLPARDVVISLDPATVRSRFAQFDPARTKENNIMAGMAGAAMLPPGIASVVKALRGDNTQ